MCRFGGTAMLKCLIHRKWDHCLHRRRWNGLLHQSSIGCWRMHHSYAIPRESCGCGWRWLMFGTTAIESTSQFWLHHTYLSSSAFKLNVTLLNLFLRGQNKIQKWLEGLLCMGQRDMTRYFDRFSEKLFNIFWICLPEIASPRHPHLTCPIF
jgi:hypothetical protein